MKRALFALAICGLFLAGCGGASSGSRNVDLASWQRGVEQYLVQKNNDPEALRDVTLEDGRRGFAVLGADDPRKATDQRALLLAHKAIGDRPWFVYLVGAVSKDVVQDLRLVALSATGGQTLWRVGPRNAAAFKLYHDAAMKDWHDQGGGGAGAADKSKPPVRYTTFPRAGDVFDVTIDGSTIRAKHVQCGAEFHVDVAQHVPTPSKKNKGKT